MHKKWPFFIVCLGMLGVSWQALADNAQILPTDDKNGCSALIQQGDVDPAVPTRDIATLQLCMASCNDMYQSLSKEGRLSDMLRGASYCRQSLNNLYYASVAQNIYEQLDAQTQQENMAKKALLSSKLKQLSEQRPANNSQNNSQNKNNNNNNNNSANEASDTNSNSTADTSPKGPPEDVNWF